MTFDSIKNADHVVEWLLEQAADKGNKDRDTASCYTVVLLSGPLEVATVLLPTFTDL